MSRKPNPELTEFERKMWYLLQVCNRMSIIYENFAKLSENESTHEYNMQSVVREYAIIQLANFIDIKQVLESEPVMKTKKHLKECLEPFAAPITSRKESIDKLRDSFYAHIGDKPKKRYDGFMEELIEDKFPKNPEEIVFLAGSAYLYCHYFIANFKEDFDAMSNKVESARPLLKREPHRTYEAIHEELKKMSRSAASCLDSHGQNFNSK